MWLHAEVTTNKIIDYEYSKYLNELIEVVGYKKRRPVTWLKI